MCAAAVGAKRTRRVPYASRTRRDGAYLPVVGRDDALRTLVSGKCRRRCSRLLSQVRSRTQSQPTRLSGAILFSATGRTTTHTGAVCARGRMVRVHVPFVYRARAPRYLPPRPVRFAVGRDDGRLKTVRRRRPWYSFEQ